MNSTPVNSTLFNRARPFARALVLSALLFGCAAGCIEKRVQQTLYIEADGTLTWLVLESQVRSNEKEMDERTAEETEYLAQARSGRHKIAEALALLAPFDLESDVLRDRRPFEVRTEARFGDPAEALSRYLDAVGVVADVRLQSTASVRELVIRIDLPATESEQEARGDDSDDPAGQGLVELWPGLAETRIVLATGHFVDAVGFEIDGTIAHFLELEPEEEDVELVYSLVWSTNDA